MPAAGMDLSRKFAADLADTRRRLQMMAGGGGLRMVFGDHVPNSRRALEATEYATTQGKGEPFHWAVFQKLYAEGLDISRWDVLREAAVQAGLDPEGLERETGSGAFAAVLEAKLEAARTLGVKAVPTFVINGRYRIVGAQPYEVFREALTQIPTGEE